MAKQYTPSPWGDKAEGKYVGEWEPEDIAIYSDFGLRSLFIIQVLTWPEEKPDRFTDEMGVTHDKNLGSVRGKVIDTTLVDWDFDRPPSIPEYRKVGTIHYYHYTNLYRDINELIRKETRILKPEVRDRIVSKLKSHTGWHILQRYGLTGQKPVRNGLGTRS